ncbi:4-hydroxy-tetrahydrodipicolinate reductase [Spirillospora sp. NBC_01491]|uniref:4-hydroxy-tetrahydrodipicolinate reductase n=1 Tax=Spirillospora sp. NBC_01491 TaxID=2976007 RepID=UPI002E373241|nr:4-hydroxy-tetrahydrodipicolinate reductase [Spirillospora sp. NBC_01491]
MSGTPTRVGVIGAGGRMGRAVCAAVRDAADLELVAAVHRGEPLDPLRDADVAVDFSIPDCVMEHLEWTVARGVHTVVGTSGVGAGPQERIAELCAAAPGVGVHVVPNFSVAAVLATRLAAEVAGFFDDVEIVEYAHRRKLDAPAGTAEQTARVIAAARGGTGGEPPEPPPGEATTRGRPVHGVPVHSVRTGGVLSRQDVRFGRDHELLSIGFETLDRAAFLPGVLLAVRGVAARPGLTVGLDALLTTGPAQ